MASSETRTLDLTLLGKTPWLLNLFTRRIDLRDYLSNFGLESKAPPLVADPQHHLLALPRPDIRPSAVLPCHAVELGLLAGDLHRIGSAKDSRPRIIGWSNEF